MIIPFKTMASEVFWRQRSISSMQLVLDLKQVWFRTGHNGFSAEEASPKEGDLCLGSAVVELDLLNTLGSLCGWYNVFRPG